MNKSNKPKQKKLQTHEPELLNPAHHNHALSKTLSKRSEASINLKSWIHASLPLISRDLRWNVTCTRGGFEPPLRKKAEESNSCWTTKVKRKLLVLANTDNTDQRY